MSAKSRSIYLILHHANTAKATPMCRAGKPLATARTPEQHTEQSHHTASCRVAEEQNASIFGHKGKAQAQASPEIADEHPPRYRGMPDTPNERLVTVLQEALDVASGMDPYLLEVCTPASEACATLGKATEDADWGSMYEAGKTMFRFSNAWTTDLVEAKTLAMFAYMLKAKRVMEIGMFTGYGALTIAEVLPAGGKMVTCEIDPFLKEFTRPFFDRSPHGSKIEVRLGSAIDTMNSFDINVRSRPAAALRR